ncbi:hypothetical protein H0H81_005176, partial [Sphagnurus paluster]
MHSLNMSGRQKEENTEATRKAREQQKDRKLDYDKEMVEWEKAEAEQKLRNGERDKELKTAKEVWQREKKDVKAKGGKIKDWKETHPEPKQSDPEFKHEPTIKKPKRCTKKAEDSGEQSGEEFDLDVSSEEEE